jgi:hypothetical protein
VRSVLFLQDSKGLRKLSPITDWAIHTRDGDQVIVVNLDGDVLRDSSYDEDIQRALLALGSLKPRKS